MSGEGDSGLVERLRERLAVWDAANYEVLTTIQVDVADVREAADEIERLTGTRCSWCLQKWPCDASRLVDDRRALLLANEVLCNQRTEARRARDSACREADRAKEALKEIAQRASVAFAHSVGYYSALAKCESIARRAAG